MNAASRTNSNRLLRAIGATLGIAAIAGSVALLGPSAGQASAASPCTATCYVNPVTGSDLDTGASSGHALRSLQLAVARVNSGGVVVAAPGLYNQLGTTPIGKPMTLKGANAGTYGDSVRGPESTVTVAGGTGIQIGAPNVVIDGFQFSLNKVAIEVSGNVANVSGFEVKNSAFVLNGAGVWATKASDAAIDRDLFEFTTDYAVFFLGGHDQDLNSNVFRHNPGGSAFFEGGDSTPISNVTFHKNFVTEDQLGASPHDAALDLSRVNGAVITQNEVTAPGKTAIRLESAGNVQVESNYLQHSKVGVAISGGFEPYEKSITVTGNALGADTTGISFAAPNSSALQGSIDFTRNWWGSSTGPQGGPASGTGSAISSGLAAAVYSPWLCSSQDTQPLTPGFQPSSSTSPCDYSIGTPVILMHN